MAVQRLRWNNTKIVAHAQFRRGTCFLCTRACGYGGDLVELL